MEETTIFLQKLLETTIGISFSRIAFSKADLQEHLQRCTDHIFDELLQQNNAFWQRISQTQSHNGTVYECTAPGGITFLIHPDKALDVIFLAGPALFQPFSRKDALYALEGYHMPQHRKTAILQFCGNLPIVQRRALCHACDLIFRQLTGKQEPLNIVQINMLPAADKHFTQPTFPAGGDIVQMRQVEMRYEYSAALTDAIKQGNLPLAMHMVGNYDPGLQTTIRNTNPLRNAQNYCIVLNTQLRHALEESGIHPYWVDKLSNEIGLEIEQLKNVAQLPVFFSQIIRRYCRLVQEHAYPNLKPLTNLAVTYIKEHLADNLTVKDTAKALTVNANYLSSLFHQEMGMTFIDFVNRERTNQAAALLKHTNLQIQQIASNVGYNNTSYFAKQFLKFQGATPSHYRRNANI